MSALSTEPSFDRRNAPLLLLFVKALDKLPWIFVNETSAADYHFPVSSAATAGFLNLPLSPLQGPCPHLDCAPFRLCHCLSASVCLSVFVYACLFPSREYSSFPEETKLNFAIT